MPSQRTFDPPIHRPLLALSLLLLPACTIDSQGVTGQSATTATEDGVDADEMPGADEDAAVPGQQATADDCEVCEGAASDAPNIVCWDGSIGGPVCERQDDGVCRHGFRDCPPEPEPEPGTEPGDCEYEECEGVPSRAPNILCWDGSTGGPVCERQDDGVCRHTVRSCPPEPEPEPEPGECAYDECEGIPSLAPNILCWDGSTGGPVCERQDDGVCRHTVRSCPPEPEPEPGECAYDQCEGIPSLAPNILCWDGSTGGPVCERQDDGVCRHTFRSCPPEPKPCAAEECTVESDAPNFVCEDGSLGGPVCERQDDGVCREIHRVCPGRP